MFEIVPYKLEHLIPLLDQKENVGIRETFLSGTGTQLEIGESATLIVNGKVACCGGVIPYWEGRVQGWIVFSDEFKTNFIPVFRGVKAFLKEKLKTHRRIEASATLDFPSARRKIELFGFKLECELAKGFLPDGRDCALYSMVRE